MNKEPMQHNKAQAGRENNKRWRNRSAKRTKNEQSVNELTTNKMRTVNSDTNKQDGNKAKKKQHVINRGRNRKLQSDNKNEAKLFTQATGLNDKSNVGNNELHTNPSTNRKQRLPHRQEYVNRNHANNRSLHDKRQHETISDIQQDIARIQKEINLALVELRAIEVSL